MTAINASVLLKKTIYDTWLSYMGLKKTNAKVSKLAQGLPVGGEIESLDDGTLFSAFKNRTGIETNSD